MLRAINSNFLTFHSRIRRRPEFHAFPGNVDYVRQRLRPRVDTTDDRPGLPWVLPSGPLPNLKPPCDPFRLRARQSPKISSTDAITSQRSDKVSTQQPVALHLSSGTMVQETLSLGERSTSPPGQFPCSCGPRRRRV